MKKKKSKGIYRTGQKMRIINVFLESLLSESFPSLGLTVHLISLGALQHRAGLWVCCGGSSGSHLVLPLCALAFSVPSCQNQCVSLVGALSAQCVSHRFSICPADHVGSICSSYSRREGWSLPPQPRCPWVSAVVLFPPLCVAHSLGFAPEAALGGLGLPL